MRITTPEKIAICVTLIVMLLVGAFYLGRSTADSGVIIQKSEEAVPSETAVSVPATAPAEVSSPEPDSVVDEPVSASEEETDSGLLDLNHATLEELETLPRIGPVLAQRIIDYREANGGFTTIEELKNVSGIGDKTFAALENLVEVGN